MNEREHLEGGSEADWLEGRSRYEPINLWGGSVDEESGYAGMHPAEYLAALQGQRNVLWSALEEIAAMDYRGNEHPSAAIARKALGQ